MGRGVGVGVGDGEEDEAGEIEGRYWSLEVDMGVESQLTVFCKRTCWFAKVEANILVVCYTDAKSSQPTMYPKVVTFRDRAAHLIFKEFSCICWFPNLFLVTLPGLRLANHFVVVWKLLLVCLQTGIVETRYGSRHVMLGTTKYGLV